MADICKWNRLFLLAEDININIKVKLLNFKVAQFCMMDTRMARHHDDFAVGISRDSFP